MQRDQVLAEACAIITTSRAETHGSYEENYTRLAGMWSAYLGVPVSVVDVTNMLVMLKIARARTKPKHADNWIDMVGYAACGAEVAGAK